MTAPSLATSSPLVSLFHDPAGTAFADLTIESHRETWPIRSKRFRSWLRRCYYQATREAASAAVIRSALDLLEARAQFDGRRRVVHMGAIPGSTLPVFGLSKHWCVARADDITSN